MRSRAGARYSNGNGWRSLDCSMSDFFPGGAKIIARCTGDTRQGIGCLLHRAPGSGTGGANQKMNRMALTVLYQRLVHPGISSQHYVIQFKDYIIPTVASGEMGNELIQLFIVPHYNANFSCRMIKSEGAIRCDS